MRMATSLVTQITRGVARRRRSPSQDSPELNPLLLCGAQWMPAMPCCLCLSAHPQMGDSGRNEATGAARPAAAPQASNYPFSGIRGYNGREGGRGGNGGGFCGRQQQCEAWQHGLQHGMHSCSKKKTERGIMIRRRRRRGGGINVARRKDGTKEGKGG